MIFPNRAPNPQMRPGMGYAPGARSLGYAPGARGMGYVAHMGYAPGARGMGDFSPAMENAAVDANIAPSDIDLLNSLGATDQDLTNLINGNVTLSQLYAQYGVTIAPAATATANTAPASTVISPAPVSTAQIPPGSTILYTATYNPTPSFTLASTVVSSIAANLAAHGMSMLSNAVQASGLTSNGQFTMTIMDSVGHALISDAQSVLDALLNQFTSNEKVSSSLTVVSPGTTASGTSATASATDAVSWLESNALYIALGIGGLIFLNNFTGKRR